MDLKDMIQRDSKNIFFNPKEFGEPHTINDKEMIVIIDNNEMLEREKRKKAMDEGLYTKQLLVYVCAEEFGKLPGIGRTIILDGKTYRVTDAIDESGIYSIQMEVYKP